MSTAVSTTTSSTADVGNPCHPTGVGEEADSAAPGVIAGQGTIAMEILRQHSGPIHAIFVAIGGGGLIAGIGAYVKQILALTGTPADKLDADAASVLQIETALARSAQSVQGINNPFNNYAPIATKELTKQYKNLRLGDGRRELPLEKFFLEYGRQDRRPGEFVETVIIPRKGRALIAAYKMSKRQSADISAISAGFRIAVENGIIASARVAFGGMAGIPARAVQAEAALEGRPFTAATFEAAACAVKNDFTPLTDFRATADYRHAVAANFFRRFWLEHSGQEVPVRLNRAVGE